MKTERSIRKKYHGIRKGRLTEKIATQDQEIQAK